MLRHSDRLRYFQLHSKGQAVLAELRDQNPQVFCSLKFLLPNFQSCVPSNVFVLQLWAFLLFLRLATSIGEHREAWVLHTCSRAVSAWAVKLVAPVAQSRHAASTARAVAC